MEAKHQVGKKKAGSNWFGGLFWLGCVIFFAIIIEFGSSHHLEASEAQVRFLFALYWLFALGLYMFVDGFKTYREYRLLTVTTKSPIRGLTMGFVEISGLAKAADEPPRPSPVSQTPSLSYIVWIEDSSGKQIVDLHTGRFYLEDETGKVLVVTSPAKWDWPITCECEFLVSPSGTLQVVKGSPNEPALAALISRTKTSQPRYLNKVYEPGESYRLIEYSLLPDHRYSVAGTCVENPSPQNDLDRNMIVKGEDEDTYEISWHREKDLKNAVLAKGEHTVYGGAAIMVSSVALILLDLYTHLATPMVLAVLSAFLLFGGVGSLQKWRRVVAAYSTEGSGQPKVKPKRLPLYLGIYLVLCAGALACVCLASVLDTVRLHRSAAAERSVEVSVPRHIPAAQAEPSPADHVAEATPGAPRSEASQSNVDIAALMRKATRPIPGAPAPPRALPAANPRALPRTTLGFSAVSLLDGSVTAARPVCQPPPEYPQTAQLAHIQGSVVLNVTITKDGAVRNVKVLSGHPLLVQAALDGVQRWHCAPTIQNGQPVDVNAQAYVGFSLPK